MTSSTLPGEHYCEEHQGNFSHYDPKNCTVCCLKKRVKTLVEIGMENRERIAELEQDFESECKANALHMECYLDAEEQNDKLRERISKLEKILIQTLRARGQSGNRVCLECGGLYYWAKGHECAFGITIPARTE